MKIGHVTLLVKDFDEAAKFYVEKLGFVKRQDTTFWGDMRWVTVSPKDQPDLELTFVLADTEEKRNALGKQAGDHVFHDFGNGRLSAGLPSHERKGRKVLW